MKTYGSATTFHIAELDSALRFYTDTLGFTEAFRFGDYAGVRYGEVQIHLSGPRSNNKRGIGQGGIYIFCDDVDAYFAQTSSKGAKAQNPPQNYEYGMRDFVIEDLDGNLITFGLEWKKEV